MERESLFADAAKLEEIAGRLSMEPTADDLAEGCDALLWAARLVRLGRRVSTSVSTEIDWETIRASDLDDLRKLMGVL